MFKKIVQVDFDGVIHSYRSGWKGADVAEDPPVPGAIRFLRDLISDDRFTAAIYSSRSCQEGGINCMKSYLQQHGLTLDEVNLVEFPTTKGPAFLTIDDRAFQFDGIFPMLDEINDFKPWNKSRTTLKSNVILMGRNNVPLPVGGPLFYPEDNIPEVIVYRTRPAINRSDIDNVMRYFRFERNDGEYLIYKEKSGVILNV